MLEFFTNLHWQFDSVSDFFAMGTHGLYVWICYGVATVLLAANLLGPMMERKKTLAQLKRRFRSEQSSHRGEL